MSKAQLQQGIITLSESKEWSKARTEWKLEGVHMLADEQEAGTCLCGHNPIREICEIINTRNGNSAEVGNRCVNQFLGLHCGVIFDAIKRIRDNPNRSLNREALAFLLDKNQLTQLDHDESVRTMRKRKLTKAIRELRAKVNGIAIAYFKRRDPEVRELATQQGCETASQFN